MAGFFNLPDINNGPAARQTLGEAPPDRKRQTPPVVVGEERPKPAVVEKDFTASREV